MDFRRPQGPRKGGCNRHGRPLPWRSRPYGRRKLGRPQPFKPLHRRGDGGQLPKFRRPQRLPHHSRRQRHLPSVVRPGGGGNPYGCPRGEHLPAWHGLVHRPDEMGQQRERSVASHRAPEPVSVRHQRVCYHPIRRRLSHVPPRRHGGVQGSQDEGRV